MSARSVNHRDIQLLGSAQPMEVGCRRAWGQSMPRHVSNSLPQYFKVLIFWNLGKFPNSFPNSNLFCSQIPKTLCREIFSASSDLRRVNDLSGHPECSQCHGIHHIIFSIFHKIFLEKSFSPLFTRIFSRKYFLEKILVYFFFSISHEISRIL